MSCQVYGFFSKIDYKVPVVRFTCLNNQIFLANPIQEENRNCIQNQILRFFYFNKGSRVLIL